MCENCSAIIDRTMSFPKISRQFFDYFPKLVDTLPNFVDTFLKKQTFILNQLTVSIDSLSIFVVEDRIAHVPEMVFDSRYSYEDACRCKIV